MIIKMRWLRDRRRNPGSRYAVSRECRYWADLLTRSGLPGVTVREVARTENGCRVRGRFGDPAQGWPPVSIAKARKPGEWLAVHKRLPRDAVRIEKDPDSWHPADFVVRVGMAGG
jgi:hypothetical protein